MHRAFAFIAVLAFAAPLFAQHRVDFIVDVEGVKRTGKTTFEPNTVRYEPRFDNGGGIGVGVNWFLSSRVSLEIKVSALESHLRVRRSGSDFVSVADLGRAQIYPVTAILQWHMLDKATFRPYLGAGVGHVILRNVEKPVFGGSGITFDDPTGLVLDGGLEVVMSRRWSLLADARYTPIETTARATFGSTGAREHIDVKPLVVSFGAAVHF